MKIKQFKDHPLAHYSYALVSNGQMALVDPARDPMPYYQYAEEENAQIVAIFETHPHADFVSGHLQIQRETGASIYISEKVGVSYLHIPFDDGQRIRIGDVEITALETPGHSPDSLSFFATDGKEQALFTGDTLFIGDVGRPDLRENAGNQMAKRRELAEMMYQTIQTKFKDYPDSTIVYPAHGAGSLCGKNLGDANSSTLGEERKFNWAFQAQDKEAFVQEILKDQPFIPNYFGFNVDLNRKGAQSLNLSKYQVPLELNIQKLNQDLLVVDARDATAFKKAHLPGSINIMARGQEDKFETWLGSLVRPEEPFYLVIDSVNKLDDILSRTAKIGYEKQVKAIMTLEADPGSNADGLDLEHFKEHSEAYHILDIRNKSEVAGGKIFDQAFNIPLNELRDQLGEIPQNKPIVVHCAGGYRSAAGSSLLKGQFPNLKVYDLGENIQSFN